MSGERRTTARLLNADTLSVEWAYVTEHGAVSLIVDTNRMGRPLYAWGVTWHYARQPVGSLGEICAHTKDCPLTGGDCWGDIGGLVADELLERLQASETDTHYPDMEIVWSALEDYASKLAEEAHA